MNTCCFSLMSMDYTHTIIINSLATWILFGALHFFKTLVIGGTPYGCDDILIF